VTTPPITGEVERGEGSDATQSIEGLWHRGERQRHFTVAGGDRQGRESNFKEVISRWKTGKEGG